MNTYIKEAKQVLVWQSQLRNVRGEQVRKGKIAAQLAHASLKAILDTAMYLKSEKELTIYYGENPALEEWLTVWCMRRFACRNFQFTTEFDSKLSYTPC